jgi:cytochrome bd-type quinol oxidase subunit 2
MLSTFKKIALALILIFAFTTSFSVQGFANSEAGKDACEALSGLGVDCTGSETPENAAAGPVRALINVFSIVVGAASVVMIIFGGFKFITSAGDADKTKSARNTIIYAAGGLAIVVLAQFIVLFVFDAATEISNPPAEETTYLRPVDKLA